MTQKRTFTIILILLVLTTGPIQAELPFSLKASPKLLFNSGSTDYTIEALTYAVSEDLLDTTLVGIRSKLEFPLDAALVGFDLEATSKHVTEKGWTINIGALINITDPDKMMEDHDWFFDPDGSESIKWSWTESRAKLSYLLLKFEIAKTIARGKKLDLSLMAGFHYNRVELDMIGYSGWQVSVDNVIKGQGPALYYRVTYKLPQVGVRLKITPSWQTIMELQLAGGRLMASDLDDHLLRGKTAEATTAGWAFLGQAAARLMLARSGSARLFLAGRVEFVTQSASGTQTQEWYRDEVYFDPVANEEVILARKGTVISGINYETTARQVRLGLGLGLAF